MAKLRLHRNRLTLCRHYSGLQERPARSEDDAPQVCGDYRGLKDKQTLMRYPIPMPAEIFEAVGQTKIFITLDLCMGFNQLSVKESDRDKTFWGVDERKRDVLYRWNVMPFGLKNAPAEFQRVMDMSGQCFGSAALS